MKIAILIVHAQVEPFESIRNEVHPLIYEKASASGIDVYYALGKQRASRFRFSFNNNMEKLRHSRYYLISRLYDYLILNIYRFFPAKYQVNKNEINVAVPEDLRHMGVKVLASLEFLLGQGYEWIYRTTTSSVINIPALVEAINSLGSGVKGVVAGSIAYRPDSHNFIVGSNLLLNYHSARWIVKNRRKWDHSLMDDVALGRLVSGVFDLKNLSSESFSDLDQVSTFSPALLKKSIQFRCKSSDIPRRDADIMKAVYRVIR